MNPSRVLRSAILAPVILVAHAATAGSLSVVNAINNVKAGANQPTSKLATSGHGVSQRPVVTSPVIVRPNGSVVSSASLTKTGTGTLILSAGASNTYSGGVSISTGRVVTSGATLMNTATGVIANAILLTAQNLTVNATAPSGSTSTPTSTTVSGGTVTYNGNNPAVINGSGGNIVLSGGGTISGSTGSSNFILSSGGTTPTSVVKTGNGNVTLNVPLNLTGDLTINAGSIILANSIKVSSVKFGGNTSIEFSNAASTAEPLEVAGGVSVSDPGSAFTSGNVTDILTPAGAIFPDGTDIHVINATATGAVLTITNHSGAALVIKASTTVPNGITISRP